MNINTNVPLGVNIVNIYPHLTVIQIGILLEIYSPCVLLKFLFSFIIVFEIFCFFSDYPQFIQVYPEETFVPENTTFGFMSSLNSNSVKTKILLVFWMTLYCTSTVCFIVYFPYKVSRSHI